MTVSKHLVEIRYKPAARVLDRRGEITDALVTELLNQWNITPNKIDLSSESDKNIIAFFSYKNLGLVSQSPHDKEFFQEKATQFIKTAWPHVPTTELIRVGIRSTFYIASSGFTETFEGYKSKFLKTTDEELKVFNSNLVDVGFALNFSDGDVKFNIQTGPMEREQAKSFFGDEEELPEAGIYVDIDFFRDSFDVSTPQRTILSMLSAGIVKAEEVKDIFCQKLVG